MQVQLYTIPILGGEKLTEELNAFLRSRKILQVESELMKDGSGAFWCFCVKYIDALVQNRKPEKVDYKEVLDESTFQRFSELRAIRKKVADGDGVPAYAVFTNEELAELANLETINAANMRAVKGIGEKKVEKYGLYFFTKATNEKS